MLEVFSAWKHRRPTQQNCSTVMLVVKSSESSLNKNTKEMQGTVEALIGTPGKFTMNNGGQYPGKL